MTVTDDGRVTIAWNAVMYACIFSKTLQYIIYIEL